MSKNGSWIYRGKDGENYESVDEQIAADNRWDQQQQQNKLLEQQNELIKKQNRVNERLTREQMENQRRIENSRQSHEKEMRLLNLCDEIGISNDTMESFINYILDEKLAYENFNKELKELDKKINKLTKEKSKLFKLSCDIDDKNQEINDQIDILNKIKSSDFSDIEYGLNKDDTYDRINSNLKCMHLCNGLVNISAFACFFTFIYMISAASAGPVILLTIEIIIIVICIAVAVGAINKISNICDEKIKILKDSQEVSKTLAYEHKCDEVDEYETKRMELLYLCKEKKLNEFLEFRIEHYNSKIEKFLIDYGFKTRFGKLFRSVTKSQAKGTGDIDDYIDYFDKVNS